MIWLSMAAAWLRSWPDALVSINVVTVCRAWLILGLTVCEQVNHFSMYPATLVDSAFYPPFYGKMSISFQAEL